MPCEAAPTETIEAEGSSKPSFSSGFTSVGVLTSTRSVSFAPSGWAPMLRVMLPLRVVSPSLALTLRASLPL